MGACMAAVVITVTGFPVFEVVLISGTRGCRRGIIGFCMEISTGPDGIACQREQQKTDCKKTFRGHGVING